MIRFGLLCLLPLLALHLVVFGCGDDGNPDVSCSDGVKNQDETDVDCGGTICTGCPNGATCSTGADCTTGNCDNGLCTDAPACTRDSDCGSDASCIEVSGDMQCVCDAGYVGDGVTCVANPPILTWLPIQGGTFEMGSDAGSSNELPIHSVTVPSFEMSKTEVTVDQYQACVDDGDCILPLENTDTRCNWIYSDRGAHPINCVYWDQAVAFCDWVGGRLPSESEWEYAARSGGQDITYPWGENTVNCDYAVLYEGGDYGCGERSTWAVCSKIDGNTDQDLCDMAGNVWEWVQDVYHSDYTGAPTDGSAWGDDGSFQRIGRGGGFGDDADCLRAAGRYSALPGNCGVNSGFRCAR